MYEALCHAVKKEWEAAEEFLKEAPQEFYGVQLEVPAKVGKRAVLEARSPELVKCDSLTAGIANSISRKHPKIDGLYSLGTLGRKTAEGYLIEIAKKGLPPRGRLPLAT